MASPGPRQIGEIFVDKEGSMVVIESAFTADEEFDLLDPGGMVDQALEGGTGLIDLLQVEAIVGPILMAVNVAGPVADLEGEDGVDLSVTRGHFCRS